MTAMLDGGATPVAPSHLDFICPRCHAQVGECCRRDRWSYTGKLYPARSGHLARLKLARPAEERRPLWETLR